MLSLKNIVGDDFQRSCLEKKINFILFILNRDGLDAIGCP